MKNAIITYTKNYWDRMINDQLTLKDVLLLAGTIMVVSFGILYAINPAILQQL